MIRERILSTTDVVDNVEVPFIDLTICPDYLVAYKDTSIEHFGLDKYAYGKKGIYVNQTHDQLDDPRIIFDSITYSLDEILSWIVIYTNNGTKDGVKIKIDKTKYYDDIEITNKYWSTLGRCYSIHPKNHLLEQSILRIEITSRIDTYIYFGYPGQLMHPNSKTKVYIGTISE